MTKTTWECKTPCYENEEYPYCVTKDKQKMYCVEKVKDLSVKPSNLK
jgi:hypothetical protein